MNVKVHLNKRALATLAKAQEQALTATAQHMLAENKQAEVMPRDTGNLQNMRSYVDSGGARGGHVEIVTDAPYAQRLYWHPEFKFKTHKNALAGALWWEMWISGSKRGKSNLIFAKMFKKMFGGG